MFLRADIAAQQLLTFATTNSQGQVSSAPVLGADGFIYLTDANGSLVRVRPDGSQYAIFSNFPAPLARLTVGSSGMLFGVGSATQYGTGYAIFEVGTDGSGYKVLHTLNPSIGEGDSPQAPMTEGPDHFLYGTTAQGGANGAGSIFKIDQNGGNFSTILSFSKLAADGKNPEAAVVFDSQGVMYGTTYSGGSAGYGTVYSVHADGTGYQTLYAFGSAPNDGNLPSGPLLLASDGMLYGTLYQGALNQSGALFRLRTDGSGYQILHQFSAAEGNHPSASLIEGANGVLYGMTGYAGANGAGALFQINKDGTGFALRYNFVAPFQSGYTSLATGLLKTSDGGLYAIDVNGGVGARGVLLSIPQDGSAPALVFDFGTHFAAPQPWSLCLGSDGLVYGTTAFGTVFRVSPDGTNLTNLFYFPTSSNSTAGPNALVFGKDGKLYGTTLYGGANRTGSVYRLSTDGTGYSVLLSLPSDGSLQNPLGIIQGTDGFLYVTTKAGGTAGLGTVFKLRPDGTGLSIIHNFVVATADGQTPSGSVIQGSDGRIYGGTAAGGSLGGGVIFGMNADGTHFSVLTNFGSNAGPVGRIAQGSDGHLYVLTIPGSVIRLNVDGSGLVTLGTLSGIGGTGNVIQGADGGIYGTGETYGGRSVGELGEVFRVAPDGSGEVQYASMTSPSPDGCLVALSNGQLVCATFGGGGVSVTSPGTLYQIIPNQAPPPAGPVISFQPQAETIACGANGSLSVTATGTGLTYQWQLNGQNIPGATAATYSLSNTATTQSGSYTVVVTDSAGLSKTSVAAAVQVSVNAHPINISTRAMVGEGANSLVAGFVVFGGTSETILIRGIGPTLGSGFQVPGALPDVQLTVFDSSGNPIATNAAWAGNPVLSAAFAKVGAFPLDPASGDAAVIVTVPPGNYSASISGGSGETGVGLIEVYDVPGN